MFVYVWLRVGNCVSCYPGGIHSADLAAEDNMSTEGSQWLDEEIRLNALGSSKMPQSQKNFWLKPDEEGAHDPRAWPSFIASHIEPYLEGGRQVSSCRFHPNKNASGAVPPTSLFR